MSAIAELAGAVRTGQTRAAALAEACLARIAADGHNAITRVLPLRARAEAAAVDATVAAGGDPGPLAGVPYVVKDLFDVAGIPTTAGAGMLADSTPATADADAIARLRAAGGVLVGTANMDEFAYGFATINAAHGTTRNPHDPARLAGGSSGGSAAAVAAGLVPFSLGSDTNGSIRVPASLCGIYGLKPTHGGLPMGGVFPFAESFDDIGPFATSAADIALVWRALAGVELPPAPTAFRVGRLGGRFRDNADAEQLAAIDAIAGDAPPVVLPGIGAARAAAFLITACEGGSLHRERLRENALAFDPATRDRLLAGSLLPETLHDEALEFRARFREEVLSAIAGFDVLLAPATPCVAPTIADPRIRIDGAWRPARADLGIHTQPVSFLGLPALAVPLCRPGRLPIGIQLIGWPGGEHILFAHAAELERRGMIGCWKSTGGNA